MVNKNRIITLVLAAVVLTVVCSGNAFASDFHYMYALSSYIDEDHNVLINTQDQPIGWMDVQLYDTLSWYNTFMDYSSDTVVAKASGRSPYPANLLLINDAANTLNPGEFVYYNDARMSVNFNPGTSYKVYAKHKYTVDGTTINSAETNGDMNYY